MGKRVKALFLTIVVAVLVSSCGGGSGLDTSTQFTTASSNATLENVGRTIATASAYQGWQPRIAGPGRIVATRHHAGHIAKISISYTTNSFTIQHLNSDNMGYTGSSISSVYEDWIDDLRSEIKRRLSAL
ncbi:MAG: hypothetical protein P8Z75_11835 [Gammaproteobacteria bacterium]|jgi:hypothetical protein